MVEIKKNRIEWIDTAKGLTILLVVLGHTTSINTTFLGVFFLHLECHCIIFFLVCFLRPTIV